MKGHLFPKLIPPVKPQQDQFERITPLHIVYALVREEKSGEGKQGFITSFPFPMDKQDPYADCVVTLKPHAEAGIHRYDPPTLPPTKFLGLDRGDPRCIFASAMVNSDGESVEDETKPDISQTYIVCRSYTLFSDAFAFKKRSDGSTDVTLVRAKIPPAPQHVTHLLVIPLDIWMSMKHFGGGKREFLVKIEDVNVIETPEDREKRNRDLEA